MKPRRSSPRIMVLVASLMSLSSVTPTSALERQVATIQSWPPSSGEHCWVSYQLAAAVPDTACWNLIWDWSGFQAGDVVGMAYQPDGTCAPSCRSLHALRMYFPQALEGPGDEISIHVFCADSSGCPSGAAIASRVVDPGPGWNNIDFGDLPLGQCPLGAGVGYLVTVCWMQNSGYPHIATDNMESISAAGCSMPPGYPRSDPDRIHSGIFAAAACSPACPATRFQDQLDHLELVWDFAMSCFVPGSLEQNVPDPFCNTHGGDGTNIQFALASDARVTMQVWDAGMVAVVRTLIDGQNLPAGAHMVRWDGLDTLGAVLPAGPYPYRLTAADRDGSILFEDTKVAHVDCTTLLRPTPWSRIKALYRD